LNLRLSIARRANFDALEGDDAATPSQSGSAAPVEVWFGDGSSNFDRYADVCCSLPNFLAAPRPAQPFAEELFQSASDIVISVRILPLSSDNVSLCCFLILLSGCQLFVGRDVISIDVKVAAGNYELGALYLQDDMVLSLDSDNVIITFSEDAAGPSASFTAGQTTEKSECSLGCHTNYWEYVGQGAEDGAIQVDLSDAENNDDLVAVDNVPCWSDSVVIPQGR
jgi:hypothetical protein